MGIEISPLYINTTFLKVHIEREMPRVIIDQYECFAEAGLKGSADFMKEYAELGKQVVLETIGKIAQEGDAMAQIENGKDMIAELAFEKMFDDEKELIIDCIPKSRPKVDVAGDLRLEWEMGSVEIQKKRVLAYKVGDAVSRYLEEVI